MSTPSVQKARDRATLRQAGLCHYCGLPMLPQSSSPTDTLRSFAPSAEHLVARCEGGGDHTSNIVAAHIVCNQRRHKRKYALTPDEYKRLVMARVARGRWHPASVLKRLTS